MKVSLATLPITQVLNSQIYSITSRDRCHFCVEVSHGSGRNMHVNIHVATQRILKNFDNLYNQGNKDAVAVVHLRHRDTGMWPVGWLRGSQCKLCLMEGCIAMPGLMPETGWKTLH